MDSQYLRSVAKYVLSAVLSIVLIAYILYHLSGGFSPAVETMPATLVTRESTITVSVTLMRNETVLYAPVKGDISYLFQDGDKVAVSILNQYTPLPHVAAYPELNRKVTEEEYEEVVEYALSLGIGHGFLQEGQAASESFIPEF